MLRLLRQIARTPLPVVHLPIDGGTLRGRLGAVGGLLTRGLVEEVEWDGVKVYAPTDAGRRELELSETRPPAERPSRRRG